MTAIAMKVKLVKAKSPKRWYAGEKGDVIGKTFKVAFSEEKSLKLERNVFEILSGKYKGKFLDVKDTRIVVKLKAEG